VASQSAVPPLLSRACPTWELLLHHLKLELLSPYLRAKWPSTVLSYSDLTFSSEDKSPRAVCACFNVTKQNQLAPCFLMRYGGNTVSVFSKLFLKLLILNVQGPGTMPVIFDLVEDWKFVRSKRKPPPPPPHQLVSQVRIDLPLRPTKLVGVNNFTLPVNLRPTFIQRLSIGARGLQKFPPEVPSRPDVTRLSQYLPQYPTKRTVSPKVADCRPRTHP
jgi:hypothetical protein